MCINSQSMANAVRVLIIVRDHKSERTAVPIRQVETAKERKECIGILACGEWNPLLQGDSP